jgi:hypothetical protein
VLGAATPGGEAEQRSPGSDVLAGGRTEPAAPAPPAVLAIVPKDEDAFACKVVANMQLGQHEAALALIGKNAAMAPKLVFEKVQQPSKTRWKAMQG